MIKTSARILALCCLILAFSFLAGAEETNPVANPNAVVTCGNARFTVLTDRLIRMEWSADGKWEDRATLAVINRDLPVPEFTTGHDGDGVTIKTNKVTLRYDGNGKFNAGNLKVSFGMNGKEVTWKPGDNDKGNLMGTTRSLDGCEGFDVLSKVEKELEKGILSRDGWAIVDESSRHVLVKDDSDWGEWVDCRDDGDRQDLYIFAYGHDYKAALADFTKVAGKIPMPPKFTFGYWWSRFWAYTDTEMLDLAKEMRKREIPIDVFIIDMDWHELSLGIQARYGNDEFGNHRSWSGYTWNRNLIPDPVGFLHDMHALNLKTALNLHPADGIRPYDDFYEGFVKDYLSRTNDYDGPEGYVYPKQGYQFVSLDKPVGREGYRAPVPFRISQREWTDAYFNSVIHPLEKQGVDFWWLDWQQWITSRYMEGLNTTFWLNYTFFNDMVRQSRSQGLDARRPLIYHRWGGLGSHRYQLGFSGDTYDEWSVLEFLPYFTATASNVGYGYWGHDIGGHMNLERHLTNPEMYTRWIQYGVFTPIFKTHSSSFPTLDRRIWSYPTHYEYMREAIKLRYALSPYIYTAARHAYDTGVSICRPLYYDYPEVENAYTWNQEYMFGDQILATVLCKPIWKGKTERSMWFPEGNDWYDMASHKMMKGGQTVTLYYTIDQNPWFVKAGSIIPLAEENIQSLQQPSNKLRLLVIPGKGKSAYTLYEDDGDTQNYKNDYATTTITKEDNGNTVTMQVAPRNGSYKNMPATRQITVMLEGVKTAPKTVKFNGSKVNADAVALKNGHVEVTLPETACSDSLTIEIQK